MSSARLVKKIVGYSFFTPPSTSCRCKKGRVDPARLIDIVREGGGWDLNMAATRGLQCPATNSKTRFMSRDFYAPIRNEEIQILFCLCPVPTGRRDQRSAVWVRKWWGLHCCGEGERWTRCYCDRLADDTIGPVCQHRIGAKKKRSDQDRTLNDNIVAKIHPTETLDLKTGCLRGHSTQASWGRVLSRLGTLSSNLKM